MPSKPQAKEQSKEAAAVVVAAPTVVEAPAPTVAGIIVESAPTKPALTELAINEIRTDGGTQSRAAMSEAVVTEYAEAVESGATFPPLVVFRDGSVYWLADGFHRRAAFLKAGREVAACEVREGSLRDAIVYSAGANAGHGLRRSNEDKRFAVTKLLSDRAWSKKSDRWIAEVCGVSHPFVIGLRAQLVTITSSSTERVGSDGKTRKLPAKKQALPVAGESAKLTEVDASTFKIALADAEPAAPDGSDGWDEVLAIKALDRMIGVEWETYRQHRGDPRSFLGRLTVWARQIGEEANDTTARTGASNG